MIKCDKAMRRSKERGYVREGVPWRCDLRCDDCHCALHKRDDGTWEHRKISWAHVKKEKFGNDE